MAAEKDEEVPNIIEEGQMAAEEAEEVPNIIEEGPFEKDLLVDYEQHISREIWLGRERKTLRTICHTNKLYEWMLVPQMETILQGWGFGLFYHRSAMLQTDSGLITALVERWRWESNSFHLTCGETTVTLEDVSFILNLPVYGLPMTTAAIKNPKLYWIQNWFEELSKEDIKEGWGKAGVKLKWIRKKYRQLPKLAKDRTPEVLRLHCKAYIFYLCGAVLFPSRNSDVVYAEYLALLQDEAKIRDYSWGAGVLCHMYRALGDAARASCNGIAELDMVKNLSSLRIEFSV